MEDWQFDFEWLQLRHKIKDQFSKGELPDLNAVLFLIGMQELGEQRTFSKEEKQDLMHIAVCKMLSTEGMFEMVGKDDDGWPHYEQTATVLLLTNEKQERLLKEKCIAYFKNIW